MQCGRLQQLPIYMVRLRIGEKLKMPRIILALTLFLPLLLRAQSRLEIVEPAGNSLVRPGETLIISLRTSNTYADVWLTGDDALETI